MNVRLLCLTLLYAKQGPLAMTQLTVTAKGQITLRKDLLKHLGLRPGDKLDVSVLPDGRAEIRAARPHGTVDGFIGLLAGETKRRLSVDDMNRIASEGWAKTDEDHR